MVDMSASRKATTVQADMSVAHDAAHSALTRQLALARRGRSMLYPFVGRSRRFEVWQHYPRHDAIDITGRWQFYFHAHEPGSPDTTTAARGNASVSERGHIHLFRRSEQGQLSHLAGLSLDARGVPLTWFATNQWVTNERWMAADALTRGLSHMVLRLHGPLAGAALWLADLVRLYAASLQTMLRARDHALAQYCRHRQLSCRAAWMDRQVAIWSSHSLSWPQDALQLASQVPSQTHSRRSK